MRTNRMITRTVEIHRFSVMVCDTETAEVNIIDFTETGVNWSKDFDKLKELKKRYETDTVKLVAIQGEHIEEVLYGMSEADFIANAEILPPRFNSES